MPRVRAVLAGVNASVVGVLLAALYDPVWTSAVRSPADFARRGGVVRAVGVLAAAGVGGRARRRVRGRGRAGRVSRMRRERSGLWPVLFSFF